MSYTLRRARVSGWFEIAPASTLRLHVHAAKLRTDGSAKDNSHWYPEVPTLIWLKVESLLTGANQLNVIELEATLAGPLA